MVSVMLMPGTDLVKGQTFNGDKDGTISYISGNNVYVKFSGTSGIEDGDTLYFKSEDKKIPCLVVRSRSSLSCLCDPVGDLEMKTGDKVWAIQKIPLPKQDTKTIEQGIPDKDIGEEMLSSTAGETKEGLKTNFTGRLSASSYSLFSGSGKDSYRIRYTLSATASEISGSKLSTETYLIFTHKINDWHAVQQNIFNALKIYNLALKYEVNKSVIVWAGRKINPRIANAGAIDGVQFELILGKIHTGIFTGTRPDYSDYGFNSNLFQYGAWVGHSNKLKNGFAQTSLAFIDQRYFGKTDRRVLYFQHTNTAIQNLSVFSSVELDLFRLEEDQPRSMADLTSFYLSLHYRINRQLSVSGSYDNRKNVIYYETFRNYADEILQQSVRQGVRVRINYKPIQKLSLGINAGNRHREGDKRQTNTLNGSATWSDLPWINSNFNLSASILQTSYLDGQIYGARLSKSLLHDKISGSASYRRVSFNHLNSATGLLQNIGELDFSWHANRKLYFSFNIESTFQGEDIFNRLYLNVRRNF
jgi:hypothetical protein